MLKRIITGVLLIVLAIAAIVFLPDRYFYLLTVFVFLILAFEWLGLFSITKKVPRFGLMFLLVFSYLASFVLFPVFIIFTASFLWWCVVCVLLWRFSRRRSIGFGSKAWGVTMAYLTLTPVGISINLLHAYQNGTYILFYALALVWIADSSAYFIGKSCGKTPLTSTISPKKTWEGLLGALLCCGIYAAISGVFFDLALKPWTYFVALSLVAAGFSVIGDLYISVLKRSAGIKDTGSILPGHGGLLDRLDGLCAAAPIFNLGLLLMTKVL